MSLNPLSLVTDYQSMLNRIFWFTTASALAAMLTTANIPTMSNAAVAGLGTAATPKVREDWKNGRFRLGGRLTTRRD